MDHGGQFLLSGCNCSYKRIVLYKYSRALLPPTYQSSDLQETDAIAVDIRCLVVMLVDHLWRHELDRAYHLIKILAAFLVLFISIIIINTSIISKQWLSKQANNH